ncbi:MAG: hypothetical protein KKG47_07515 [Proteobacteria bacterium]|nr:hypothetical protein [Pseudomonadota bacterium]MBU1739555.1 hypothetical protein [Pseudomonadota bacterium]
MQISRIKLVALVAAVLSVYSLAPCFAQNRNDGGEPTRKMDWLIWDSVERFTGQATVQLNTWIDRVSHGYYKEKTSSKSYATFHFELVREPQLYSRGHSRWIAGKVRVNGNEVSSSLDDSPTHRLAWSSQAAFDQTIVKDAVNLNLSLNHETGEFQMGLPTRLDTPVPSHIKRSEWNPPEKTINEERTELLYNTVSTLFNGQAPTKIGVLHATSEQDYLEEDGRAGHRTTGSVVLVPEYSDFKVVVELAGYDDKGKPVSYEKWRPFGSIKEPGKEGNYLDVKAVLQSKKDVKSADLPKVKYFRFELVNTSREPGVAMNWPLNAEDKYPDMRLDVDPASPGRPGKEGQSLEVSRPVKDKGRPAAMARIDSFDFGGRTVLLVTAELADGRPIVGRLEGQEDTLYPGILIPKRLPGRWIAEAWLTDNDVAKFSDEDDGEDEPSGDGYKGDGFTLYEEYRGFAMSGKDGTRAGSDPKRDRRVEGNPKRKDFFILNLMRSDALAGIRIFEKATGLAVHSRLSKREMSEKDRLMNGNRREAPHREEQHGVVIKFDDEGPANFPIDYPLASKPRNVKWIGMPHRNDLDEFGNKLNIGISKPWNLPAGDFARAYDRTVAHELLHSVGADHHGPTHWKENFYYIPAAFYGDGRKMGQLVIGSSSKVRDVDVFEEATGFNWLSKHGPDLERKIEAAVATEVRIGGLPPGTGYADLAPYVQYRISKTCGPHGGWLIGYEHGDASGNEQCLMRYYFTNVYPVRGKVRTQSGLEVWTGGESYYWVPPGTEDIGLEICTSPKGTGVNASDRKGNSGRPMQSRYGDAAERFGNCDAQICPNDAAPERPRGWKRPKGLRQ